MGLRKGISNITSLIIWMIAIILVLCLAGAYINPSKIPILGLLSLLTGPMIILSIIMLIYSIGRNKRTGFVTLISLFLAIPQISNLWGLHVKPSKTKSNQLNTIKVLTFNVRNFDLYNWSHNNASREEIFKTIQSEDPDVICFQEFYSKPNSKWDNIQKLKNDLGLKHYYFTRELVLKEGRQWGIATFSKFPIVKHDELIRSDEKNKHENFPQKAIFTDIAFPTDTIRFINTHLASIYLNQDDYSTIEKIGDQEGITIEKSKPIVTKLLKAYKKRGNQVTKLSTFLKESNQPHPIIICGDFNDLPTSYAYNEISKNYQDAFLNTNWGLGATYNGPISAIRIDFMFVDKNLTVCQSEVIDLKISDHFPLLVTLSLD